MSDVYVEEPMDEAPHVGTLRRLRLELARTTHRLERAIQAQASNAVDETRFLMLKTRKRINARLGTAAAIALGTGLALGLLAALAARSRR
ncbi:MAG TPA: hypothetical protein VG889_00605 [Rhizomicrobium sp.]|nr:hypothetical protein [Rhizomicrobium sp.]